MKAKRALTHYLPLTVFILLTTLLWRGLALNPASMHSALLNKPVPEFRLSTVENPKRFLTNKDLQGHVSLLNVWASWCSSCFYEVPIMKTIARSGVALYSVNYKDDFDMASEWLAQNGNPYRATAFDPNGDLAINLGVYGTPELFVIDKQGFIRFKYVGALSFKTWQEHLKPLIKRLEATG